MTLPKLSEAGEAARVPVTATPVPARGMPKLGFEALLVTVMEPLAAPATVGANVAVSGLVAPAAKVNGVVTAVSVNPLPEMETAETVTDAEPLLVRVTV